MFTAYATETMLNAALTGSYAALHYDDPRVGGGEATELSGGGYVRVDAGMTPTGMGAAWNTKVLNFGGLLAGKITHVALWDKISGGKLLCAAQLTPYVQMYEGGSFNLGAQQFAVSIGDYPATAEDTLFIAEQVYNGLPGSTLARLNMDADDALRRLMEDASEKQKADLEDLKAALKKAQGLVCPMPGDIPSISIDAAGKIVWEAARHADSYEVNKCVDNKWGADKNVGFTHAYQTEAVKPGTRVKARARPKGIQGDGAWKESATVLGKFDGTVECRVLEIKPTSCRIDVNTTKRSADGKTTITNDYWWDLVTDTGWWIYTDSGAKNLLWTDGVPSNNKSAWCWVLKPDTQYWVKTGVNIAGTWFHSGLQTLKTPKS